MLALESPPVTAESILAVKRQIAELMTEKVRRLAGNRLASYCPYPKQAEFHAAGARNVERLLMAGNQLGKTWSAAYETAMHLTGRYPAAWTGRRFDHAIKAWACGETTEVVRDSMQLLLCGPWEDMGTGSIPRDAIVRKTVKRGGVPEAVDTLFVKHATGGESRLTFKSYDAGREKFQAATLHFVWLDEEPDEDIYLEAKTRINATHGSVVMTFTPLKGMTSTVKRFRIDKMPGTHVTVMTIYDAGHYTDEQRAAIIASYPEHIREARAMGIPTLGSGRIFPIKRADITVDPFPVPEHWPRIAGIDFGWTHPSAAVDIAWNQETDVLYVCKATRRKEVTPLLFAAEIKPWGSWLPWAWPSDGLQQTSANQGIPIAQQYREQGLAMLEDRATHAPEMGRQEGTGGNGVDAGLLEMLDRMQTGRLKVFFGLNDWFEEFEMYHRDDGKIVKLDDDLMDATRYAVMMKRHAATRPAPMAPMQYKRRMVT